MGDNKEEERKDRPLSKKFIKANLAFVCIDNPFSNLLYPPDNFIAVKTNNY